MLKHNSIVSNSRWHNIFLVLCITAMAFFLNGCAKAKEYKSEHDSGAIAINSVDDFFHLPALQKGMKPDKVAKYFKEFCYYPSEFDGERIIQYEARVPFELSDSMAEYSLPSEIIISFNADKELIDATASAKIFSLLYPYETDNLFLDYCDEHKLTYESGIYYIYIEGNPEYDDYFIHTFYNTSEYSTEQYYYKIYIDLCALEGFQIKN